MPCNEILMRVFSKKKKLKIDKKKIPINKRNCKNKKKGPWYTWTMIRWTLGARPLEVSWKVVSTPYKDGNTSTSTALSTGTGTGDEFTSRQQKGKGKGGVVSTDITWMNTYWFYFWRVPDFISCVQSAAGPWCSISNVSFVGVANFWNIKSWAAWTVFLIWITLRRVEGAVSALHFVLSGMSSMPCSCLKMGRCLLASVKKGIV